MYSRKKKQNENLLKDYEAKKVSQKENRPLGSKHRILEADRNQFGDLIEAETGEKLETKIKPWKPMKWRNFCVRAVCSSGGEAGEKIRNIWAKIYKGDLKWGVRDARIRAKGGNGPSYEVRQLKDRNSWIAFSLLNSYQAKARLREKKGAIKLMQ